VKREDKIKEDSQLFQIKTNKKLAKKNKAKKGKGKKKGNKFLCKNHLESSHIENCKIEKSQGRKKKREETTQIPSKKAKFSCYNCNM
jgi:hypothetical protein